LANQSLSQSLNQSLGQGQSQPLHGINASQGAPLAPDAAVGHQGAYASDLTRPLSFSANTEDIYAERLREIQLEYEQRVSTLRENYDERIHNIAATLQETLRRIGADEVIATMRADPASQPFAAARLVEILDGTIFLEREGVIRNLTEELAVKAAQVDQLQRQWVALQARVQSRDAALAQKDASMAEELRKAQLALEAHQQEAANLERARKEAKAAADAATKAMEEMKEAHETERAALRKEAAEQSKLYRQAAAALSACQEECESLRAKLESEISERTRIERAFQVQRQAWTTRLRELEARDAAQQQIEEELGIGGALAPQVAATTQALKEEAARLRELLRNAELESTERAAAARREARNEFDILAKTLRDELAQQSSRAQSLQEELKQTRAELLATQDELSATRTRAQQTHAEFTSRLAELSQAYEDAKEHATRAEAMLEASEADRLELRQRYLLLGNKLEALLQSDEQQANMALVEHQQQTHVLVQKFDDQKRINKLERKEARERLETLQRKLAQSLSELRSARSEIDRLQSELDRARTDRARAVETATQLEERERVRSSEHAEQQRVIVDKEAVIRRLTLDLRLKEQELDMLKTTLSHQYELKLDQELARARQQAQIQQQQALETQAREFAEKERAMRDTEEARVKAMLEEYKAELLRNSLTPEAVKARESKIKLEHAEAIQQLQAEHAQALAAASRRLQARITQLEEELDAAKLETQREQVARVTAEDVAQKQRRTVEGLRQALNEVGAALDSERAARQDLETQLNTIRQQLDKVQQQTRDQLSKAQELADEYKSKWQASERDKASEVHSARLQEQEVTSSLRAELEQARARIREFERERERENTRFARELEQARRVHDEESARTRAEADELLSRYKDREAQLQRALGTTKESLSEQVIQLKAEVALLQARLKDSDAMRARDHEEADRRIQVLESERLEALRAAEEARKAEAAISKRLQDALIQVQQEKSARLIVAQQSQAAAAQPSLSLATPAAAPAHSMFVPYQSSSHVPLQQPPSQPQPAHTLQPLQQTPQVTAVSQPYQVRNESSRSIDARAETPFQEYLRRHNLT